ncbi:C39 family peptidase [Coraliomargarita sinensis]|nr:C39 family peptidase [Coraliomargarita sinensis]
MIRIFLFALLTPCLYGTTLTDTQGRSIEVDILEVSDDSVKVRRSDGYVFNIPFSSLSTESKGKLKQSSESEPTNETYDFESLNQLLELKLWKDTNLWDDPVDQVAKRLGWPRESKTGTQSSYRIYFRRENSIAGARPYTAVLYGREGKVDYLSVMFANKGDSVPPGSVEDMDEAFEKVNDAIDADLESISARFDTLGESQNEIGGISRGMKERAVRWDTGNNSFWLAAVENEYIALRIMPPELADTWGRPEYQSDETVRQAAAANVKENKFGDVLIQNIPMVNQGPKGYCVPATIERCLRYMGIRADMYTLAMAGSTTIGGGTRLSDIIEGTSSYVRRSSRKMETISDDVSIKTVSEYIDQGQPLMWTMYSTNAYNRIANSITKQRRGATDYKEWRKTLRDILRDAPDLLPDRTQGHLCMIVGYNKNTDEIAVSDSWGPRYELRWITAEQADMVSQGSFYIIDF